MVGLNLNPAKGCNFDCAYCDVPGLRHSPGDEPALDLKQLAAELDGLLGRMGNGALAASPGYRRLPPGLLVPRQVAISGLGEPTLCPQFAEVVETVLHLRATGRHPFFKLILITNASALERGPVRQGLNLFTLHDEVWVKLDAGTQAWMDRVNRSAAPLAHILENILSLARGRPVIIQSLLAEVEGRRPDTAEIGSYVQQLKALSTGGARIRGVQIYSANRVPARPQCRHLPLVVLSEIARKVRAETGLDARAY
jgi:wyosine [tRNA(Phe)-imidazoG37] synthetase (radical SAM superfamily)